MSELGKKSAEESRNEFYTLKPNTVPVCSLYHELNRYGNVLPTKEWRVKLPQNGYINADYVCLDKPYILTQAPIAETIITFWKMIFQEKASLILNLTDFVENGIEKSICYWDNFEQDEMSLRLKTETEFEEGMLRLFDLTVDQRTLEVVQIHCPHWPDHGVVKDMTSIYNILYQYRTLSRMQPKGHLSVIHCSAGIGRSGTLLAIHTLLNDLQHKVDINVLERVKQIRQFRVGAVQTVEQYHFIHKALYYCFQEGLE